MIMKVLTLFSICIATTVSAFPGGGYNGGYGNPNVGHGYYPNTNPGYNYNQGANGGYSHNGFANGGLGINGGTNGGFGSRTGAQGKQNPNNITGSGKVNSGANFKTGGYANFGANFGGQANYRHNKQDTSNPVTSPSVVTSPAEVTTPIAETSPAEVTTPIAETSPAEETTPIAETSPAEVTTPIAETSPAEVTTPIAEDGCNQNFSSCQKGECCTFRENEEGKEEYECMPLTKLGKLCYYDLSNGKSTAYNDLCPCEPGLRCKMAFKKVKGNYVYDGKCVKK